LRSKAIVVALALSTVLALWAETPAQPSKPSSKKPVAVKPVGAKKTATKASTAKASQPKGATAASHTGRKAAAGKKSAPAKTSGKQASAKQTSSKQVAARYRRSTQREPAPDRYQEIQQSLADKGYFAGPVNGTWGPDSVEALKRFQRDQNIGDDGKLGSLSLIALGLGPKRGTEKSENSETGPTPP
jgi:peptidoglycan hydrolase-like protein with peptidoglycan-binding domain